MRSSLGQSRPNWMCFQTLFRPVQDMFKYHSDLSSSTRFVPFKRDGTSPELFLNKCTLEYVQTCAHAQSQVCMLLECLQTNIFKCKTISLWIAKSHELNEPEWIWVLKQRRRTAWVAFRCLDYEEINFLKLIYFHHLNSKFDGANLIVC